MKAILMLEDGFSFQGKALGVRGGERIGEVVLNTAVVGYQEMITDPVNAGKILILTYPLIGNYGLAPKFNESRKAWLAALVIKEKSRIFSNWQAKMSLDDFIKGNNLFTLTEVDTRTLAVHLREKGEMKAIVSTECFDKKELLSKIKAYSKNKAESQLAQISTEKEKSFGKNTAKTKVAILDLGITNSMLRQLETLNVSGRILPYQSSSKEILKIKPKGLIISNGPEQDINLKEVAQNLKPLIKKIPILAIGTGFQVLASALGVKINKMKLGHRGVNYPIKYLNSYKGEITVQNHSYVVDKASLAKLKDIKLSGVNLNDNTVEEIESNKMKLIGIQYYPSSPGFNEVNQVFKKFVKMIN
jgi:carbamoyl-phosphate synthase small subunit